MLLSSQTKEEIVYQNLLCCYDHRWDGITCQSQNIDMEHAHVEMASIFDETKQRQNLCSKYESVQITTTCIV